MTHDVKKFDLGRLWAIARKESLHLRRDARSLALAFLLPAVMLLLFGAAITTDVENIKIAILDRDHTSQSRRFIEAFGRSGYFTLERVIDSEAEAEELIARGTIGVAIVIPEGFASDLAGRRPAPIELLLDGADAKTATVARGYADAIASSYYQTLAQGRPTSQRPAAQAESRVWYNESLNGRHMIVPGLIAVIMSIIAAMLTSLTIAREWERGTMEQLAATPVSRAEVILGKLLPYMAIGLIDVAIAVVSAVYVFGVPLRGSALLFGAASFIFLTGVLGLGILISSVVKSQLLATQAAIFATYVPALILSGFMYALSNMPWLLQVISRIIPARYFVEITRGIFLRGIGLDVLWVPLVGLSLYAMFVVAMSVRVFKKELV
ncbi:MAG TPA: ABC transporter permease [Gemmatimonadaceae bacterium]|nr:ABC transporter permease [Gemmatimonadaceae bacterium]